MNRQLGVSLYLSNIDKIEYLKKARNDGIENLFVSIHTIEDVKNKAYEANVLKLFEIVEKLNFKNVICDISPVAMEALGIKSDNLNALDKYPVNIWRLDFGFTDDEICEFSKMFKIAINASQVTDKQLDHFDKRINKKNVVAFHNFYPLPGSGLSLEDLAFKDSLLRERGYNHIYSFIGGKNNLRPTGNFAERLVTLENSRDEEPENSFNVLANSFRHKIVFIADPDYFQVSIGVPSIIEVYDVKESVLELNKVYYIRNSENFIRLKGTRSMVKSESGNPAFKHTHIEPIKLSKTEVGDILICNSNAERYLGEIVFVKKPLQQKYLKYFNLIGKANLSKTQIQKIEQYCIISLTNIVAI